MAAILPTLSIASYVARFIPPCHSNFFIQLIACSSTIFNTSNFRSNGTCFLSSIFCDVACTWVRWNSIWAKHHNTYESILIILSNNYVYLTSIITGFFCSDFGLCSPRVSNTFWFWLWFITYKYMVIFRQVELNNEIRHNLKYHIQRYTMIYLH